MRVIISIGIFLFIINISYAQNYSGAKISTGIHFNGKTSQSKSFYPGFLISGFIEPRVSTSGNIIFNIDYGYFKFKINSGRKNKGRFSLLAGYKQKFFYGKSNIYISGSLGFPFGGIGYKLSIGNEYAFIKSNYLSLDFFVTGAVTTISGDGGEDKPAFVVGATIGIGFIP